MASRPHNRWLLLGLVAIALGAWGLARFSVSPRDRATEERPHPPPAPTAPPEIGIRAGASFTTADGRFTVRVTRVAKPMVALTVSATTGDVYRFDKAEVGRRLVVPAPDATYFLDLHRIRGDTVYMTMSKDQ